MHGNFHTARLAAMHDAAAVEVIKSYKSRRGIEVRAREVCLFAVSGKLGRLFTPMYSVFTSAKQEQSPTDVTRP